MHYISLTRMSFSSLKAPLILLTQTLSDNSLSRLSLLDKWIFKNYLWSSVRCHWVLRRQLSSPSPLWFLLGCAWHFYKTGSSGDDPHLSSDASPSLAGSGTKPDRNNVLNELKIICTVFVHASASLEQTKGSYRTLLFFKFNFKY